MSQMSQGRTYVTAYVTAYVTGSDLRNTLIFNKITSI